MNLRQWVRMDTKVRLLIEWSLVRIQPGEPAIFRRCKIAPRVSRELWTHQPPHRRHFIHMSVVRARCRQPVAAIGYATESYR
jgi:hypothetical protein